MSLPNYGNIFPDDILGRIRDLETAVNELEGGTFAAVVTLAGDVTGQSDATVVGAIQGYAVSSTAPGSGEVLEWDGSAWTPTALSAGSGDLSKNVANTGITTWTSLRTATTAPTWRLERSLGTAGSPTAVTVGFTTGGFTFGGYDGTDWASDAAAGLFGKTSENWSSTAHGMFLSLETTPEGSTDRLEALRITAGGDLLNVRGFQSLRPDGRFAYQQRAANLLASRIDSATVIEMVVADSFGHDSASDPEQTSWPSVYEKEMADRFNRAPRTAGYMPVRQYGVSAGTATGIEWDTVQGTAVGRGPTFQNRQLTGSQYCEVAREGTAVTVYYTAQETGGGTATVTINGTTAGTINSTDGTLGAGTYDSGRSVTYTRTGYGPINLKVQITSGTAFELEGCYFHNQNDTVGFQLIRADKSGQQFTLINDVSSPYLFQAIGNIQPHIVTVMLGFNDVTAVGVELTASELAAELVEFVDNVRAEYSTWTPSIRYVFQNDSDYLDSATGSTWQTDYRRAMRNACLENDVLFIDGHDAVGSIVGTDPYDFSDDGTHPNDHGHWVFGQLVADHTVFSGNVPDRKLSLVDDEYQELTSTNGRVRLKANTTIPSVFLGKDSGAAVSSGDFLGTFAYSGAIDAYGTMRGVAAVRADAEGNFSSGESKAGLRFQTTSATTPAVRGGFTNAGDFFIGATSGTATFTVVGSSGNTTVGGSLTVTGTHPFLTVDGTFNTVTGANGLFGTTAFANAPLLGLRRAQGSSGSPTNITSGLNLAVLGFYGYNSGNADYLAGATIRAVSEEAWSTTGYRGARLEFLTALSATNSAAVVRALINNAGNFYVGATAAGAVFSVLQASGNTSVSGTLGVTGATTLSSTLDVTGLTTVTQGTVGQPVMQLVSTATNDDPTETVRQFRLQTTSNAPQTLGDASLPASSTTMVQAFVVARTTAGGTANDGAGYILTAVFQNGVQIGTTSQTVVGENQSAWDATLNYNANKWRIVVTGAASVTITWHATVRIWSVGS